MGGAGFAANSANKIKGGRWTVVKFFAVSCGYTCVWMAMCSELGHFRRVYGPSVLLKMNIMYYLPSIPLLAISGTVDEPLDRYFGVTKTVLVRLLIGMGGCAVTALLFPFEPERINLLLGTIAALGVAHGISFSASYQLVSRFANKNTIALGLGCVGSGALVLLCELASHMGSSPTLKDEFLLYDICAGLVVLGLVSAVSLLLRHWRSIEAFPNKKDDVGTKLAADAQEPLLSEAERKASLEAAEPEGQLAALGNGPQLPRLRRHDSVQALLALSPLDFFKSVSEGDSTLLLDRNAFSATPSNPHSSGDLWQAALAAAERGEHVPAQQLLGSANLPAGSLLTNVKTHSGKHSQNISLAGSSPPGVSPTFSSPSRTPPPALNFWQQRISAASMEQPLQGSPPKGSPTKQAQLQVAVSEPEGAAASAAQQPQPPQEVQRVASNPQLQRLHLEEGGNFNRNDSAASFVSSVASVSAQVDKASANAVDTMRRMWPTQAALFTSGTVGLLIFPFITYVPTSGLLGDNLPKDLFFVRLFADLLGRLLPRHPRLALPNQVSLLVLAVLMFLLTPLFYIYITVSPPWFHSDILACGYVGVVWLLNGVINTNAYVLAPKAVLPTQKATAAGILAVTYQGAHVCGLLAGTAICFSLFSGF